MMLIKEIYKDCWIEFIKLTVHILEATIIEIKDIKMDLKSNLAAHHSYVMWAEDNSIV